MTTYRFTINLTVDGNEHLSEDEIRAITKHLLELKQYAEVDGMTANVDGITYTH